VILRPATATWFELLTSREELGAALDCLAATGLVQLQAHSRADSRLALPDLRTTLADYETLARRYAHFWPRAEACKPGPDHALLEAPRGALEQVRTWAQSADPIIAELESLAQAAEDVRLLMRLQAGAGAALAPLDRIAAAGPVLTGRVYVLPEGGPPQAMPPSVLVQRVSLDDGLFLLAVGSPEDIEPLDQALAARKARTIALPDDLPGEPQALARHLEERQAGIATRERAAREELVLAEAGKAESLVS